MTPIEAFKSQHGQEFKKILDSPSFNAALDHLSSQEIARITLLRDNEIEAHGKQILGDVRGYFRRQHDLVTLLDEPMQYPGDLKEQYVRPEDEIDEQEATVRSTSVSEEFRTSLPIRPIISEEKPKRRGWPKGRKRGPRKPKTSK